MTAYQPGSRRLEVHNPGVISPGSIGMTGRNRGRLLRELTDALPLELRPQAIQALANAVRDLRGSISNEALPEMAYRLALFRLTQTPRRPVDRPHRAA